MTITELITELRNALNEYGDIDVKVDENHIEDHYYVASIKNSPFKEYYALVGGP